jgi:hypothetical protein
MGLTDRFNKLTKQAKDSAAEHKQPVEQALQKAAVADQRSGGKYHDQIIKAETRAEGYVENLETAPPTQQDEKTEPAGGARPSR